ncbi:MAG: YncE family protein [Blastocatellia bacterium]
MKNIIAPARALSFLLALSIILIMVYISHPPAATVAARDATPQGELRELSIDDGAAECVLGSPDFLKGKPGFGWVNKLTPTAYPATLRSVTIGFSRNGPIGHEVKPDSLYRIVVYADPEMDGPNNGQSPDATFIGRVRGMEQIMTFNLVTPLTIESGSLVVGVMDEFGIADFPALLDVPGKSTPQGTESFITNDAGANWRKLSDTPLQGESPCNKPGSFLIRATVETGAVEPLAVTTIKDPKAVEPWGVGAGTNGFVVVTNYVSDNLTVIGPDNTFQNVAVGDGPGGTPDGPFGVIGATTFVQGNATQVKAFVTLFGSNTIPSKEFPIDYSQVGPGRVLVLLPSGNSLTQAATINVGKGPMFPALAHVTGGAKLYVPCAGADRVDVIDAGRNTKIAEIPVGSQPSSCTASVNNQKVYVTNFGDGSVSVIDTKTDKKIKDIPAPVIGAALVPPFPFTATNPWQGAISQSSGNLFVTYWGTANATGPNGALAEFDTCKDEFVRAVIDDTTRGTPPGSAGATGLAAPGSPLTRNPETGTTLEAGGGGGGPFGITSCRLTGNALSDVLGMIFTNDAIGKVAVLDPRIGQVVTSPAIGGASCAKPRGVACMTSTAIPAAAALGSPGPIYAACGQPDNAVLVFKVPNSADAIAGLPTIDSVDVGNTIKIRGKGFTLGTRLEIIAPESGACLTFDREPKFKKNITFLHQKGRLSDGSKPGSLGRIIIRLILPDGTIRLIRT